MTDLRSVLETAGVHVQPYETERPGEVAASAEPISHSHDKGKSTAMDTTDRPAPARHLDYSDLEMPAHDSAEMARLLSFIIHDLFEERPKGGVYRFTAHEADAAIFASRLMVEKAEALLERWEEIHKAACEPVGLVGGDRRG